VIRGISGYADSHKNDQWHSYATATAAACAKELLEYVSLKEANETQTVKEVLRQGELFGGFVVSNGCFEITLILCI
jgi:hypothetical protein